MTAISSPEEAGERKETRKVKTTWKPTSKVSLLVCPLDANKKLNEEKTGEAAKGKQPAKGPKSGDLDSN